MKRNLLIIAKLSDKKLTSKLEPLVGLTTINRIYLVRQTPLNTLSNIINCNPPCIISRFIILSEIFRIFTILYLCLFKKIDIIMGIKLEFHGVYAGIFGKIFKKKVIQNFIGEEFKRSKKHFFLKCFVKSADTIIVRGENTRKEMISEGFPEEKIFTISNVFDFNKLPKIQRKKNKYDLIFTGNLVKVKRLDILLTVLHKIKYNYKINDFKAAIIGKGKLENKLKKMAEKLNLESNIDFLGYRSDIYNYYGISKIFIMTSESEGLPMSMIEALSYGLPCILPDISDISTIAINGYNSLLVPVCDVDKYSDAIYRLMTDKKLYNRLAKNALKIKTEKMEEFSLYNIKNKWSKVLKLLKI